MSCSSSLGPFVHSRRYRRGSRLASVRHAPDAIVLPDFDAASPGDRFVESARGREYEPSNGHARESGPDRADQVVP